MTERTVWQTEAGWETNDRILTVTVPRVILCVWSTLSMMATCRKDVHDLLGFGFSVFITFKNIAMVKFALKGESKKARVHSIYGRTMTRIWRQGFATEKCGGQPGAREWNSVLEARCLSPGLGRWHRRDWGPQYCTQYPGPFCAAHPGNFEGEEVTREGEWTYSGMSPFSSRGTVVVCLVCCNKVARLRSLTTEMCSSQLWG